MNGQQIVDAVVSQGGFDTSAGVTRANVAGWAAAAYTDLVVRARWRMASRSFGPSVAGEPEYALADDVVEVDLLRVGGRRYERVGVEQLWDLQGDDLEVIGSRPGVFAPTFDDTGAAQVALFPAPSEAGVAIEGMCALSPVELEDDAGFAPIVPEDFHWWLIDRAIVLGKRLEDEVDPDPGDAVWEARITALRMRKNSRVGSGPQRLSIFRRP